MPINSISIEWRFIDTLGGPAGHMYLVARDSAQSDGGGKPLLCFQLIRLFLTWSIPALSVRQHLAPLSFHTRFLKPGIFCSYPNTYPVNSKMPRRFVKWQDRENPQFTKINRGF